MADWTHFMLHCSDTPSEFDVKRHHLEKWHLIERKWSRLGYSMLWERSGELDLLIPWDKDDVIESWEISNGAAGWNGRTKHGVYAGGQGKFGGPEDNRTDEQKASMSTSIKMLIQYHPKIKIIGHYQVNRHKYCPSFNVADWCASIGIPEENIDRHQYVPNLNIPC